MIDNPIIFRVFSIDIGGTHIKATILNEKGEEVEAYKSVTTPHPANPEKVLKAIAELADDFEQDYDYIAAGFPGYVKAGVIHTAPNLGSKYWYNVKLEEMLGEAFRKPSLIVNDADLQGIGTASGTGFEVLITLGTGFGTAFLLNGILLPHLELAHHPIKKNTDYDQYIGQKALEKIGEKKWNIRMQKVLDILKTVFNYDRLYISGGNARLIDFELPDNVKIVSNEEGIKGAAKLWKTKLEGNK
jgi:polyphosphate glucokinase